MGGIMSCIRSVFQTIGDAIMAVISGIGNIIHALISAIVRFCGIIVSFLTCGYCGSRGGRARRRTGRHMRTTRV
ncbi:hypothetical protein FDECE_10726 [Fusarium decemcellulare]|nr:hypothetical protein FDECE_10726 [Fusarium decemcellulare]